MRFTIKGTAKGLCETCQYSHIVRFESGKIQSYCKEGTEQPVEVHGRVLECNQYFKLNAMTTYSMEKIAWLVDTDQGKVVGFVKPGTERHNKMVKDSF